MILLPFVLVPVGHSCTVSPACCLACLLYFPHLRSDSPTFYDMIANYKILAGVLQTASGGVNLVVNKKECRRNLSQCHAQQRGLKMGLLVMTTLPLVHYNSRGISLARMDGLFP